MIKIIEGEDLEHPDHMEIGPNNQEDTEYLDMGDMDTMEDMGEAMGTETGETGGGEEGGSRGTPRQFTQTPHNRITIGPTIN